MIALINNGFDIRLPANTFYSRAGRVSPRCLGEAERRCAGAIGFRQQYRTHLSGR